MIEIDGRDVDNRTIRQLKKQLGLRRLDELLAQDRDTDPYYVAASPSEVMQMEFFVRVWHDLGYAGRTGIHLRRIHYKLISLPNPPLRRFTKADDVPYRNAKADWQYLQEGSKFARLKGLIDPDAIVDKRTPPPKLHTDYDRPMQLGSYVEEANTWNQLSKPELPKLPGLGGNWGIEKAHLQATEFSSRQYHVAVVCEKTTMDDVLVPLCSDRKVDLLLGAGEMSYTAIRDFLKRVVESGMPARVLYISDFDPAGVKMPVSFARKLEYEIDKRDEFYGLDVKLDPVVLSSDQVEKYRLPRKPIEAKNTRMEGKRDAFEEYYGEGAVELDALEALYPGELASIVSKAISHYRDGSLHRRTSDLRYEFNDHLDDLSDTILQQKGLQERREQLEADCKALADEYEGVQERFAQFVRPFQSEIDKYGERVEELSAEIEALQGEEYEALLEIEPDVDSYPIPQPILKNEPETLFSSHRSYLKQMEFYKNHKGG